MNEVFYGYYYGYIIEVANGMTSIIAEYFSKAKCVIVKQWLATSDTFFCIVVQTC